MIQLQPASKRPICLMPASKRGIIIEPVNPTLPYPAIRLVSNFSGGTGSVNLASGIIPDGVKDGVNLDFTLPFDAPFLLLTLRGRVLMQDFDFTRNGVNLQMVAGNEPFPDDPFLAFLIGN